MNYLNLFNKHNENKIAMVTCYDYTSATILAETNIDALLVGDSVAMTIHGYKNTVSATIEMMCMHTQAVARGAKDKFIVTDLPFLSYRKSLSESVSAAETLMQAGANALKLESAGGNAALIRHLVESGIPIMGHIGLTPQFINLLGSYKVQGRMEHEANKITDEATKLQDAGCFAILLECVPAALSDNITKSLSVPTIGIGAGAGTDGQVLVLQDLLGMNTLFKPKFVKSFLSGAELMREAINKYIDEIKVGAFPAHEHYY